MHILLLNQYYPPDTSATANMAVGVVEHLARRHRVTVLAGRPSYNPTEQYPWQPLRRLQQGNVTVERVGSTTFTRGRVRHRLSNYLSYLALAIPRALAIRADLVLAMTDPPLAGVAGAVVARVQRKPFVYNIRDLHPDMALASGMVRPGRAVARWEGLHRWALRQADRVIVLGDDMRERVIAKGVAPERVAIVRDGAPLPESVSPPDHPVARAVRCGFPFALVHAGNLGFYGAWVTLVQGARLLEDDGVGLVFVGDGAAKAQVEAAAGQSRAVRFLPFRPASEVPHVLAAGDLHIVTMRRGLEGMVVPSKMYPVLAAGRPILAVASKDSDVAQIVNREGCGIAVEPDDPAGLAAAVRSLRHDPARLAQMGVRARAVAQEFDSDKQLERFTRIIEDAAGK